MTDSVQGLKASQTPERPWLIPPGKDVPTMYFREDAIRSN